MTNDGASPIRDNFTQLASAPQPKLGLVTARRIYADLLARPMPPGTLVGAEAALLERYEVSRGVFREAIGILEYHGVVRTERGQQGGLIVTVPSSEAASRAVALYASSQSVDHAHVLQLRVAVETEVAALAARASDSWPSSLAEVVAHLDDCRIIHGYIASRAKNRALEFLVEVLTTLAHDQIAHASTEEDHIKLIRAVESGSADDARKAMREHILSSASRPRG